MHGVWRGGRCICCDKGRYDVWENCTTSHCTDMHCHYPVLSSPSLLPFPSPLPLFSPLFSLLSSPSLLLSSLLSTPSHLLFLSSSFPPPPPHLTPTGQRSQLKRSDTVYKRRASRLGWLSRFVQLVWLFCYDYIWCLE